MTHTPFWINKPIILLDKKQRFQIWPTNKMTFEEKLNAITRLVFIMTVILFIITKKTSVIIAAIITDIIILGIYYLRKKQLSKNVSKEAYTNKNKGKETNKKKQITNPETFETHLKDNFYKTNKKNPFGNVLLTDIKDNPDKKSAPPSFNKEVYNDINNSVKKQTQMLNPNIINTNKQLYGDLKDNYDLDISMNRFYSTANTRVTNDQGAFANFLYGNMKSSKQDDAEGAMMRIKNSYRHINM